MKTMLLAVVLGVVGGLGVAAEAGRVQGTSGSAAATLEGTWRVEITVRNCETGEQAFPPFPALATFARGGTLTTSDGGMSPAARGAGHGVWWRLQGRTFAALTEAFMFGPTGVRSGTQRLSQEIDLEHDGMEFHSRISSAVLDTAGQVIFAGCATSVGRRLD
jgi:hypothetical protein